MKKILSFVLALCMICTLLPATALTANAATESGTISFGSTAQRVSQDSSKQVWAKDGITFTNNKASSSSSVANYSNPVRLYKDSSITIEAPGNITKIVVVCNSGSYANVLKNSAGSVAAVSGSTVTITLDGSSNTYTIAKLTAQTRFDSLTVTYNVAADACKHENQKVTTKAANCTEAGETSWECPDCGAKGSETIPALGHKYGDSTVVEEATCIKTGLQEKTCESCGDTVEETIPLVEHNYEDGICSVCGAEKPNGYIEIDVADLDGTQEVVITITKSDGKTYAMSNNNGTGSAPSAKPVTINDDGVIESLGDNADILLWNVVNTDGTLTIYPNGVTNKWLYCTATNNGVRVGINTNKTFTIDATSGYLKHTGTSRYIGVYNAQDWRCYTSYTTDNIKNQTLAFYVMDQGSSGEETVPATATFNGAAADISGNVGDTITMPEYTGTVMKGYTFAGWSKDIVEGETQNIDIEQAGVSYDLTGEDAFYALFSRTEKVDAVDAYKLYTGELVEGDYLIANKSGNRAMTATVDKNRFQYADVDVAVDNTIQISEASAIWHITPNGDYYTFYNAASGKYAGSTGDAGEGALLGSVTDYALWEVTNGNTAVVENKGNKANGVNYTLRNNSTYGFATYAPQTGEAPAFYKVVNEVTYYTTNPQAILYTNGSNLTKYNAWNEELSNATSGKIILCDDITVNTVNLNAGVVLDLNGCTVNASSITATVKDSADGKGLIEIAQKSAVLTSVNGQLILWDNTENASGYRAFNYTFTDRGIDAHGTDAEQTASAGILVKSFWSDLEFSNANAYMLVATSDLNVGFKLSLDGEKFTEYKFDRGASDDVIAKWGADEANNPENKNYCFYIKVTGFEALEGNGKLWVMPFVTTTHSTVISDAVSYSYTVE